MILALTILFAWIAASAVFLVVWILLVEIGEWQARRRWRREYKELLDYEQARQVTGGQR